MFFKKKLNIQDLASILANSIYSYDENLLGGEIGRDFSDLRTAQRYRYLREIRVLHIVHIMFCISCVEKGMLLMRGDQCCELIRSHVVSGGIFKRPELIAAQPAIDNGDRDLGVAVWCAGKQEDCMELLANRYIDHVDVFSGIKQGFLTANNGGHLIAYRVCEMAQVSENGILLEYIYEVLMRASSLLNRMK